MTVKTIGTLVREAAARLDAIGGTGRFDAALLLEWTCGIDAAAAITGADAILADDAARRFSAAVARRANGEPVAYITGTVGFFGRTFAVDERVLVPRPETEHLIEAALAELRGRGKGAGRVADIGTGSGAIAVSIACELPDAWVFGTDVSRGAIAVARGNAARNNAFQTCTFLRGDLAAPLEPFAPFDCIVANLPYIPSADVPRLPDPVAFEPLVALDGGPDGLEPYRRLIAQLPRVAADGASVFFEAAPGTIEPLAALVEDAFPSAQVEIGADYAGLERFVGFNTGR